MPDFMFPEVIEIGVRLNELTALQIAADMAQLEFEVDSTAVIDFSKTTHFEPFGMLFVASAVRRLRNRAAVADAHVEIRTPSSLGENIAGHMGFWQSMGVDLGRSTNSDGKESYLPITRIDVAELFQRSGGDPRGNGVLEAEAARMARILSRGEHHVLEEALTYSFRELMRNVLEHAMSPSIWIAGMSWPRRGYLQVAILDEGRGVRHSLADNPEFHFATDGEALRESLRAGVTRNKGRARSTAELERWEEGRHQLPLAVFDNMGYGLYMISSLCRNAGQFLIASGSSYLSFIASAELPGSTLHRGTALRLVLEPAKVGEAFERLFDSLQQGTSTVNRPLLSASTLRKLGLDKLK